MWVDEMADEDGGGLQGSGPSRCRLLIVTEFYASEYS
jgi:hypothetical protein